ncbi:hypothetical protein [Klebsiella pneumoniae]|uniref:hypothetical protein n=3 Tax=Klebsiella pneumoniae TaxID=573 RepID=UPI00345CA89E
MHKSIIALPIKGQRKHIEKVKVDIANLNAHALMNTAESLIVMLRKNKKTTISKVVTEWNACVEQSGYTTTFDLPAEDWTRKAQVVTDLERCAAQLEELVFATETLTVRASNNDAQTPNVLTKPEGGGNMYFSELFVSEQFRDLSDGKIHTKTARETGVINAIGSNGNTATFFAEDEVERV